MSNYWITISVPAKDYSEATLLAAKAALVISGGGIVSIDAEPPQGSLIVGNYWDNEDGNYG